MRFILYLAAKVIMFNVLSPLCPGKCSNRTVSAALFSQTQNPLLHPGSFNLVACLKEKSRSRPTEETGISGRESPSPISVAFIHLGLEEVRDPVGHRGGSVKGTVSCSLSGHLRHRAPFLTPSPSLHICGRG